MGKIKNLYSVYKNNGWDYFLNTLYRRFFHGQSDEYGIWLENCEEESICEELNYTPLISIIVPVYNVEEEQLDACIQSVIMQSYSKWQLCLVDDASTMDCVRKVLEKYEQEQKIDIFCRRKNGHISRTSNDGIQIAKGEYIAFLDCDDILTKNALYEMAKKLNENLDLDFIYSDEDLITNDGSMRFSPRFKVGWMPDNYMSHNYTNHFSIYRASIVREIGGLRVGYEGSQDYDFVLRFTEKTTPAKIAHVNKILYHWRSRPESLASGMDAKNYAHEAARKTTISALERRKIDATIVQEEESLHWNVVYSDKSTPSIDIVILSCNNCEKARKTLHSVMCNTKYKNYKIYLINHADKEKQQKEYQEICREYASYYFYAGEKTNYAQLCNFALEKTSGENVLFLNDGVEIINDEWLSIMAGQASQEHVGSVGGKVLFPNERYIYSLGYVYLRHFFGNVYQHFYIKNDPFSKLNNDFLAVSDMCYMIKRKNIEKVGGFDEKINSQYAMIDLSLKLLERGYYNAYRADVYVKLQEFVEQDRHKKDFLGDLEDFDQVYLKHLCLLENNAYYNPNCSQVQAVYRIEKGTEVYDKEPKEIMGKKRQETFYTTMHLAWKNDRLQISGSAWSDRIKRTVFDKVWICFNLKNGVKKYVSPYKDYLGGYDKTIYDKNGRKWSGFSCEFSMGKEQLEDMTIDLYIVSVVTKKIYMKQMCDYSIF